MELQNQFEKTQVANTNIIDKLKLEIRRWDLHNWVAFVGLFVFATTMGFTANSFIKYVTTEGDGWKIFFGIFDRFTYQSNWLLFIYIVFYIFKPNHQFFKGNRLLICTMVYIFFTFIGYNVVLVGISKDRGYIGNATDIASNVWLHIFAPLYFIFFGFTKMWCKPNQEPKTFTRTLLLGMIYPMIYATYLMTIPYTFTDYRANPELYGNTAVDANGLPLAYSIYGKATNTVNYPTSWAYIFVMLLGFFPGSFALFYYSWKGLNKINPKSTK